MPPVGEAGVRLRAGAGGELTAVEPALEGAPRLVRGEDEVRRRLVRGVVRLAGRIDRHDRVGQVDEPGVGSYSALVACRVDGFDREGVLAFREIRVRDRARTGGEAAAVEPAAEGGARVAV